MAYLITGERCIILNLLFWQWAGFAYIQVVILPYEYDIFTKCYEDTQQKVQRTFYHT